jgi:peptide/nickel transport system substrate-binding protein
MVDNVLLGHGAVANDNPIGPANPYFADDLEMNAYDPDIAAALIRDAGLRGLEIDLSVSNAAFPGAVEAAQLYKTSARDAGITINVVEEPRDGYWSDVWLQKSWSACYWSGRATEDWLFSTAYEAGAPWNDTGWVNDRFQALLVQARTELDSGKRRDQYREMQELVSKHGATVIPMYANFVDAHTTRIANSGVVGNAFQMDSARMIERWWMA